MDASLEYMLLERSVLQVWRCATDLFSCILNRFYFVSELLLKKGTDHKKGVPVVNS